MFVFFYLYCWILIIAFIYHGWDGFLSATIPGYLFDYMVQRAPILVQALGIRRNIVIWLYDDII